MHRPGVNIVPIHGKTPRIHDSAFIAPGCTIIGDVEIGEGSSIWYNCVLRADVSRIVIGKRSNVQDGSVLHCDPPRPGDPDGSPLVIGDDVLIGHMAMVHGCIIHDRGFVGLGAIVMNKAVIGSDAMLAAGAMLTEGKVMEPRELWGGRPARKMRDLDDAAIMGMRIGTAHYAENAKHHAEAVAAALGVMSRALGLAPSRITLLRGATSRGKVLAVEPDQRAPARLHQAVGAGCFM